jgi:hypothetical protein
MPVHTVLSNQPQKNSNKKKKKNSKSNLQESVPDLCNSASLNSLEEIKNEYTTPQTEPENEYTTPTNSPKKADDNTSKIAHEKAPWSIFDSLRQELTAGNINDEQDAKTDRVIKFFGVPFQLEKFMFLGYMICLDSFLYTFTILPLRIIIALVYTLKSLVWRTKIDSTRKNDLLKGSLIVSCSYILRNIDASRLYHSIRGQNVVRLYVIFGVLEVLEKLCSAFGHDILDSLFATTTKFRVASRRRIHRAFRLAIAIAYVCFHTIVLFYQGKLKLISNVYKRGD